MRSDQRRRSHKGVHVAEDFPSPWLRADDSADQGGQGPGTAYWLNSGVVRAMYTPRPARKALRRRAQGAESSNWNQHLLPARVSARLQKSQAASARVFHTSWDTRKRFFEVRVLHSGYTRGNWTSGSPRVSRRVTFWKRCADYTLYYNFYVAILIPVLVKTMGALKLPFVLLKIKTFQSHCKNTDLNDSCPGLRGCCCPTSTHDETSLCAADLHCRRAGTL